MDGMLSTGPVEWKVSSSLSSSSAYVIGIVTHSPVVNVYNMSSTNVVQTQLLYQDCVVIDKDELSAANDPNDRIHVKVPTFITSTLYFDHDKDHMPKLNAMNNGTMILMDGHVVLSELSIMDQSDPLFVGTVCSAWISRSDDDSNVNNNDFGTVPAPSLIVSRVEAYLYQIDCSITLCKTSDVLMKMSLGTSVKRYPRMESNRRLLAALLPSGGTPFPSSTLASGDDDPRSDTYPVQIFMPKSVTNRTYSSTQARLAFVMARDVSFYYDDLDLYLNDDRSTTIRRQVVADTAKQTIGWPYVAGGRSSYDSSNNEVQTGVDIHGLVGLIFSVVSIRLPRTIDSIFLFSSNITRLDKDPFLPGDLLFLKKRNNDQISHIMVYVGDDTVIETCTSCNVTNALPLYDRLNIKKSSGIQWGRVVLSEYKLFWGRYVVDPTIDTDLQGVPLLVLQIVLYSVAFGSIVLLILALILKRLLLKASTFNRVTANEDKGIAKTFFNIFKGNDDDSDDDQDSHDDIEYELRIRDDEAIPAST